MLIQFIIGFITHWWLVGKAFINRRDDDGQHILHKNHGGLLFSGPTFSLTYWITLWLWEMSLPAESDESLTTSKLNSFLRLASNDDRIEDTSLAKRKEKNRLKLETREKFGCHKNKANLRISWNDILLLRGEQSKSSNDGILTQLLRRTLFGK